MISNHCQDNLCLDVLWTDGIVKTILDGKSDEKGVSERAIISPGEITKYTFVQGPYGLGCQEPCLGKIMFPEDDCRSESGIPLSSTLLHDDGSVMIRRRGAPNACRGTGAISFAANRLETGTGKDPSVLSLRLKRTAKPAWKSGHSVPRYLW